MSNTKKVFSDNSAVRDDIYHHSFNTFGPKGNRVLLKDPITGKVLQEYMNKVVISGSQKTACDHFDIDPWVALPTYNTSLSLDSAKASATSFKDIPDDPVTNERQRSRICLFCCGTGGCGSENSQIYDVDYKSRIKPENIIPFRYQLIADNDLDAEERAKYFGKKTSENYYAYYFKEFEGVQKTTPYMRYTDGTNIDQNLYSSNIQLEAETYIELSLQITKEDFRDYFKAVAANGINDARINQISLCTAWREKEIIAGAETGYYVYQDIIPMTLLNIANESLIDLTKGIDITYQVFY